jgi:hypothetical protein
VIFFGLKVSKGIVPSPQRDSNPCLTLLDKITSCYIGKKSLRHLHFTPLLKIHFIFHSKLTNSCCCLSIIVVIVCHAATLVFLVSVVSTTTTAGMFGKFVYRVSISRPDQRPERDLPSSGKVEKFFFYKIPL